MSSDTDDIRISYSFKDILHRIENQQAEGFAALKAALSSKADKSDVARLETRLDNHQTRIERLEDEEHDRKVRASVHQERDTRSSIWKNKWVRVATGFAVFFATIAGPYLGAHLHF